MKIKGPRQFPDEAGERKKERVFEMMYDEA